MGWGWGVEKNNSLRRNFAPGNIWQFVVVTTGERSILATSRQRPGMLPTVLQFTGQPLRIKNYLVPNINSGQAKKETAWTKEI